MNQNYIGISEDRLHHILWVARKAYEIAKGMGYGEITGLSDADIKLLEDNLIVITDDRHPGCLWEALINVK